ncbi:glycosyltransferase family protein [Lachnospiraceae bacterium ZAX-1]
MNEKKFCFIMCINDSLYEDECVHYIYKLNIPSGYEMEVIAIKDAHSMTLGYNEGMNKTDAKYKIYLHQDVFIVNKNILYDLLALFENKSIGMVGVVGCLNLMSTAIMWKEKAVGKLYSSNVYTTSSLYGEIEAEFQEVEAIDGLIMMTQYDIVWRDDIFLHWHFYDISQSKEFQKKGYKVVVPSTDIPWCLHNNGSSNMEPYFEERIKYLKEYGGNQ